MDTVTQPETTKQPKPEPGAPSPARAAHRPRFIDVCLHRLLLLAFPLSAIILALLSCSSLLSWLLPVSWASWLQPARPTPVVVESAKITDYGPRLDRLQKQLDSLKETTDTEPPWAKKSNDEMIGALKALRMKQTTTDLTQQLSALEKEAKKFAQHAAKIESAANQLQQLERLKDQLDKLGTLAADLDKVGKLAAGYQKFDKLPDEIKKLQGLIADMKKVEKQSANLTKLETSLAALQAAHKEDARFGELRTLQQQLAIDLKQLSKAVTRLEPPPKVEPEATDVLFLAMHSGHLGLHRYLEPFRNVFASKDLLALYPHHRVGLAYVRGSSDTPIPVYGLGSSDRTKGDELIGNMGAPPPKESTDRLADLGAKVRSLFPEPRESEPARKERRCLIVTSTKCQPVPAGQVDQWTDMRVSVLLIGSDDDFSRMSADDWKTWNGFCTRCRGELKVLTARKDAGPPEPDVVLTLEMTLRTFARPAYPLSKR